MSSQTGTVLVTGAAGGVGRSVCRALVAARFTVRGLVRPGDDITAVPLPRTAVSVGYVQDPKAVADAMAGATGVVHCAALLPNALRTQKPGAFHEVNVGGTRVVLDEAARQRIRGAVFFSTISVVDHTKRHVTPETMFDYDHNPRDPYLTSKIAAEREVLARVPSFPGKLTVLRPAYVYGPGNYAVWAEPLQLLRTRKFRLLGSGNVPLPMIYADDMARFAAEWLRNPADGPHGAVRILSNPEPTTLAGVFRELADLLHVPAPKSAPVWALYAAWAGIGWVPTALRPGRLKLLTRARIRQFSRGYDMTGLPPDPLLVRINPTPAATGLANMVADYLRTAQRLAA
jgi:nucleoside-diphosphate-sugar epimerase